MDLTIIEFDLSSLFSLSDDTRSCSTCVPSEMFFMSVQSLSRSFIFFIFNVFVEVR